MVKGIHAKHILMKACFLCSVSDWSQYYCKRTRLESIRYGSASWRHHPSIGWACQLMTFFLHQFPVRVDTRLYVWFAIKLDLIVPWRYELEKVKQSNNISWAYTKNNALTIESLTMFTYSKQAVAIDIISIDYVLFFFKWVHVP